MSQVRNCQSPFIGKEPDGTESSKCPAEVLQRSENRLSSLKGEDLQVFSAILKAKPAEFDPQFQSLVAEYRTKREEAKTTLAELERKSSDASPLICAGGARSPPIKKQFLDSSLERFQAFIAEDKVKSEASSQYRKLLDKLAAEIAKSFFERIST